MDKINITMRKAILLSIILFVFSLPSFAQKEDIKVKKEIVYVDEVPVFKLQYILRDNAVNMYDLDGNKLAIFNNLEYFDSKEISNTNKDGRITFIEVIFLNPDIDKCEMPNVGLKKQLAKYILDYDLIKDGKLDDTAVKRFVKIHGTKFTDAKNKSTTVIIINH